MAWALVRRSEGCTDTEIPKLESINDRDDRRKYLDQKTRELCRLIKFIQEHGDEQASLQEIVRQIRMVITRWASSTSRCDSSYRGSTTIAKLIDY